MQGTSHSSFLSDINVAAAHHDVEVGPPRTVQLPVLILQLLKAGGEAWKRGLVIPICKGKGDRRDCGNYRGIKLLSVPGKVLAHLLLTRVCDHLLQTQRHEQSGFTPKKSTVDGVLALCVLVERRFEFQQGMLAAYVDLKKASDSVLRERESGAYWVSMGPPLGLLVSDLDFASDAVILAETLEVLEIALEALHEEAKPFGLSVNWTKITVQYFGDLLDVDIHSVHEILDSFTYLGSVVQSDGGSDREVTQRLSLTYDVIDSLNRSIWRCWYLTKRTKIFRALVILVLLYRCETWTLNSALKA
ncbi:uncharacterized protein LOC119574055 [Penaeus monodon]|uniref:uncharacterized protein LOC119574055 n=1 Tax=Penaeus monodon TaxID=6687 RepID=UPI0018A7B570|nr:uncharacterized protein LOC119574055 [Penaeus monodon]